MATAGPFVPIRARLQSTLTCAGAPAGAAMHDPRNLPDGLPVPVDDGAARHLPGRRLPSGLRLTTTDGTAIDLATLAGRTVVYAYPATGKPGVPPPDGWDAIPGARGCTPQACDFRDHFAELRRLGVDRLYGLSTQAADEQREAAERLHLPFPLLSDAALELARALALPTFDLAGATRLKRLTMVIDDGVVTAALYPVFPPDESARAVIDWLTRRSPECPS